MVRLYEAILISALLLAACSGAYVAYRLSARTVGPPSRPIERARRRNMTVVVGMIVLLPVVIYAMIYIKSFPLWLGIAYIACFIIVISLMLAFRRFLKS